MELTPKIPIVSEETVNLKTMNALIQRTAIFIYRLISMN